MKKSFQCLLLLCAASSHGAVIFSENFGTLADGTALTTSNTSFTYVRVSTGAGSFLEAQNPGSFSGASGLMNSTSGSISGLGSTGFSAFPVGTMEFSLRTPTAFGATDTFFFAVGAGTTFTGNGTFAGADLMAGYQIINGQLQVRTGTGSGTWTNVGSALTVSTDYTFSFVFNGSGSAVSYGSTTVAAGATDVYLNGTLIGDDVDITDNLDATAFRFYTTNTGAGESYEIDNVVLSNTAVPEPSVAVLGMVGISAILLRRRKL